jgi:hypothetical protein
MSRKYDIAAGVASARGRLNALSAAHGPDDPRVAAARRDLEIEKLAACAEALWAEARRVWQATAPAPTAAQLAALRRVLGPGNGAT